MVSEKIREIRNQQALSQRDLAERVGITQAAVSKIEKSRRPPKLDRLIEIAEALGVSVNVFLPNEN